MPKTTDETYGGIGSAAVEAKTGRGWKAWLALLDKAGAKKWTHAEIAKYLHDECEVAPWWSQMVTVGYEQARGLRVKHQMANGFAASASKTVDVPLAKLFQAWNDAKIRAAWLGDAGKFEIRKATANKSMRITAADGVTSIEANFYAKGDAKSQVAIEVRKLKNATAVARVKKEWGAALGKLKEMLESPPDAKRKRS